MTLAGEIRSTESPFWRIPSVVHEIPEFWDLVKAEAEAVLVVIWDQGDLSRLEPNHALGENLVAIGPPTDWSDMKSETLRESVEETASFGVWIMLPKRSRLEARVAQAYPESTAVPDVLAEVELNFDRLALEKFIAAHPDKVFVAPGAEEPRVLVVKHGDSPST